MIRGIFLGTLLVLSACGTATNSRYVEPIAKWRTEEGQKGVWRDLAAWYIDNDMPLRALEMVSQLRQSGSTSPELLLFQGRALSAQQMPEEARHVLEEAALKMTKDPRPLQALGIVYTDLGLYPEAIDTFKHALDLDPSHIATRNNLGFVLLATDRCDEASHQLETVLSEDATNARYRNNLAFSLVCIGEHRRALKLFRSTGGEAHARYNMGFAYERLDQMSSAVLQYQHALDVEPDHEHALEAMSRLEPLDLLPDESPKEAE